MNLIVFFLLFCETIDVPEIIKNAGLAPDCQNGQLRVQVETIEEEPGYSTIGLYAMGRCSIGRAREISRKQKECRCHDQGRVAADDELIVLAFAFLFVRKTVACA